MINHILTPGKVENWMGILDLGNLSMNSLPKKFIIDFISEFSHNYYQRSTYSFMLNTTFGLRMLWNVIKIFVESVNKSKSKYYKIV